MAARARVRTGNAARAGSRTAGTRIRSTQPAPADTTVSSSTVPAATVGGASAGRQNATRPVRAGQPDANTAQQRASSEISDGVAAGVLCTAMAFLKFDYRGWSRRGYSTGATCTTLLLTALSSRNVRGSALTD